MRKTKELPPDLSAKINKVLAATKQIQDDFREPADRLSIFSRVSAYHDDQVTLLDHCVAQGWLVRRDDQIRITREGLLRMTFKTNRSVAEVTA